jgi:hypothetical protein
VMLCDAACDAGLCCVMLCAAAPGKNVGDMAMFTVRCAFL